jgi:uncharacterized membrane protein
MTYTQDNSLETYLTQLQSALTGMTIAERTDIVEEIRVHVRERAETSALSVTEALNRLGPAEDLARDYCCGALVRKASTGFSPWLILRAAYAWAKTGSHGFLVFLAAIVGYALGGGLVLLALLKPLFPAETGLWVGPGVFELGFRPGNIPAAQEFLGIWLVPVCLIAGGLLLALTTLVMRSLMAKFRQLKWAALNVREVAS